MYKLIGDTIYNTKNGDVIGIIDNDSNVIFNLVFISSLF